MSLRRGFVVARALALLLAIAPTAGCATVPLARPVSPASAAVRFAFDRDTFAFPNEIRSRHPDTMDLYANYCFVLARGLRQFHAAARFDPATPRLDHEAYVARVRAVAAHAPWAPALPAAERVVIPGYADLREFSRGEERAVKEGLGGRFWTLVHWTNWRVTLPVTGAQQEEVAREVVEELAAGRLVQLLVTNLPRFELNHTVVAYAFRDEGRTIALSVWDPNDPDAPGLLSFDRDTRRFVATRIHDTAEGPIRAFRMYYAWWL